MSGQAIIAKPCRRGHTEGRNKHGDCLVCQRAADRKWQATNSERKAEYDRKWRAANPEYHRKYQGLPEPSRPCPSVCECCGGPPGRLSLNLDHCHETGTFRGWLCGGCNMAIGTLGDTLDGLERASAYLRRAMS